MCSLFEVSGHTRMRLNSVKDKNCLSKTIKKNSQIDINGQKVSFKELEITLYLENQITKLGYLKKRISYTKAIIKTRRFYIDSPQLLGYVQFAFKP